MSDKNELIRDLFRELIPWFLDGIDHGVDTSSIMGDLRSIRWIYHTLPAESFVSTSPKLAAK